MLAVDRQQRHVMLTAGSVDKGSGHDQRFLIRQRDIVPGFNRLQRRLQADKTDQRVDQHVVIVAFA